jgi:hypothetical protein
MVGGDGIAGLNDPRQKLPVMVGMQQLELVAKIAARLLPQDQFMGRGLSRHQLGRQVQQAKGLFVVKDAAAFGIEAHDALADVLQRDRQRIRRPTALGDVFNRALVEHRLAVGAGDQAGVFADPDALAGLVAEDLGDEILHLAVGFQQRTELRAAARLHIPPPADIVDGGQHFRFGFEAVDAHQRRIGAHLTPLQAAAVGAERQPVEKRGEIVVRHAGAHRSAGATARAMIRWRAGSRTGVAPPRSRRRIRGWCGPMRRSPSPRC